MYYLHSSHDIDTRVKTTFVQESDALLFSSFMAGLEDVHVHRWRDKADNEVVLGDQVLYSFIVEHIEELSANVGRVTGCEFFGVVNEVRGHGDVSVSEDAEVV